jgi:hypothetical protein
MLVIKVFGIVHEWKGVKKDGSEFAFKFQEAELLRDGHRPRVVTISSPNSGRYEEGLYTRAASSFRPNKFERLELGFPELSPLDVAIKEGDKMQKTWQARK